MSTWSLYEAQLALVKTFKYVGLCGLNSFSELIFIVLLTGRMVLHRVFFTGEVEPSDEAAVHLMMPF